MTFLRIRSLLLLIASLTVCCAAPALAWDEPDSFMGIKWGATPEDGLPALRERALDEKNIPTKCDSGKYATGVQTNCKATVKVGLAMLSGDFRFDPQRGFFWAFGWFPSRDYDALRAMFVEKYGDPTATKTEPVATRAGAALTNESLQWIGEKVVIRLSRFGAKITDGSFEVLTRAEDDRRAEIMKALQQKGKGAL